VFGEQSLPLHEGTRSLYRLRQFLQK
jgi:hypothetical protein